MAKDWFTGLDVTEPVAGADLFGRTTEKPSAIAEGFRGATAGAKASLAGFGALAAKTVGADTLQQAALDTAKEQQAVAEEHARRVEDVSSVGGAWEHYKYLLGSAAPTLALMLAGGVVGRGLGAVASRIGGTGGAAARAAAITRAGGEVPAALKVEAAKDAALARAGSLGGAVAADVPLEAGEIYNSALEQGVANPELRAASGGALAAALDFIPLLSAERYLKAAGKGGFGAMAKGAAKGAPVGAALEGGQEAAQAVIERGFAGKSLTDGEAISDYLNSFLGGAAPGVLLGGGAGALHGRKTPAAPTPAPIQNAPDLVTAQSPLPTMLDEPALDTRVQDTALLGSLADAQGGVPPQPLSTTGPQLPPTEAPSRFNRPAALVAEDADITKRDALVSQRTEAQSQAADLGQQLINTPGKRERVLLQRQIDEVQRGIPALDTQIGELNTQIGVRSRIATLPEVGPGAERTGTAEGTVLGEQQAPDTTEAERAIAETKRSLGLLVSSREAQLAPVANAPKADINVVEGQQPRSAEKQPDQQTLTGGMIEAGRQVVAQDLPGLIATKGDASLKKPSPEQSKARERVIRDAVDSVIMEAAAQPSVEQAQAHVRAELPKALKGKMDAQTVGEFADRVARGLAGAPKFYSKGKVTPQQTKRLGDRRGFQVARKGEERRTGERRAQAVKPMRLPQRENYPAAGAYEYVQEWGEFAFGEQATAAQYARALELGEGGTWRAEQTGRQWRAHKVSDAPAPDVQRSIAATDAAQDVYDSVMERKGQDAIKQFQFLYGEHGETFDIFGATALNPNAGYYQPMREMKDIVGFAYNTPDTLSVAGHEAFHALENRKLDARERSILSRAYRPGQPLFQQVVDRARAYDRANQTNITDEILSIPAEARAYGFQFWRQGDFTVDGVVATIFAKLKEFLERLGNYFTGQGFQSVEDIYRAIDRGAYAARARREGGTIRRNSDRDPADPRFAPDFATFFAAMQLKYPMFNYGKWKELPNGNLRFPYALDFRQPKHTGIGGRFLQDIMDWLDLQQRGSYIIAITEDEEKFPQAQLVKMYERRGWVALVPAARSFPSELGMEMYRAPQEINNERIFGQARSDVRPLRGSSDDSLDFTGTGASLSVAGRERWYYSALSRALEGTSTKSASREGWADVLRGLKGVKRAEIEASGLEEWLQLQSGRVSRDAVLEYLRTNGVRVEEVSLGGITQAQRDLLDELDAQIRAGRPLTASERESYDRLTAAESLPRTSGQDTKFSSYQLPGGENYRELLLTLPGKPAEIITQVRRLTPEEVASNASLNGASDREWWGVIDDTGKPVNGAWNTEGRAQEALREIQSWSSSTQGGRTFTGKRGGDAPKFQSSHFDPANILAHVRFNERTDAEGKRVLFIEEIQSDWAQKGKKEGFQPRGMTFAEWQVDNSTGDVADDTRRFALYQRMGDPVSGPLHRGVPRAPFVGKTEAWVALALKRMIAYASENGFEKVAWTTGAQQVTRYTQALQKQVDRIEWTKTPEGVHLVGYKGPGNLRGNRDVPNHYVGAALNAITLNDNLGFDTRREALDAIWSHRSDWRTRWEVADAYADDINEYIAQREIAAGALNKVVDTQYGENELSDAIGKAMAERIAQDPAQSGVIEGEQITVSDTGMSGFYDRIVPNIANDLLKKFGAGRVGEVDFSLKSGQTAEWQQVDDLHIGAVTRASAERMHTEHGRGHGIYVRESDPGLEFRQRVVEMPDIEYQNGGRGPGFTIVEEARVVAAEADKLPQVRKQQGFSIPPAMRQAVLGGGLPLFNKGAVDPSMPRPAWLDLAGRELDRAFESGKLPREQELRVAAEMFDPENMPDATAKQLYAATGAEMGKLQEFWHKHFASGNYLSRFSQGYKNVQQALSTFTQRKSQLFAHAVNVQMSEWVNANDTDIRGASDAIFKATVGGIRKNSAEYMSLYGSLGDKPKQQAMFRQVFGDAKTPGVIADMLQKEFEADAQDLLTELPDREFAEWVTNRRTRVQKLIEDSYVPERRYGDYTVKIFRPVADGQNVVLFYEQFESRFDASKIAQQYEALLKEKGVEGLRVEFGTRHQADRDTSLSLRQFFSAARRHGVELTQAERQRIARALVSADSARLNRIMRRKNIPGHSQDGLRVLSEFALTMASKIAHSEFTDAIEAALQGRAVDTQVAGGKAVISIAKEKGLWQADGPHSGFYRNLADRLTDFVLSPPQEGKWAQQLKAAGTLYFLGGNLSFGLVNLSSLPMNTVPWLSAHAPYTQAFATVLSTFKTVAARQKDLRDVSRLTNRDVPIEGIEADLRTALIQAAEDGTTLDTEIHHLMGLTKGQQFTNSRKVQKAMDAWMLPFRLSEQINRITTFSAAWRIGRDVKKLQGRELYKFAQEAVTNTQGRYDEANRPGFGQSPLWSTLFMFKSFPIFMIEMIVTLHKQSPAAAVKMMLGLAMAAGVTGLPFAEDLMDIIDVISQRLFGSPFNTKRAIRNVVKDASEALVGADLSGLFLNGVINDRLGLNLSTRVGLGNLIPGTRIGAADNDYKRTLEEVLGPAGGMLTAAASGLDHLTKGEFMDALKAGSPIAARNVAKGVQQLASGEAVDTQGRKLIDVNGWEAFWQTTGFSSAALNKVYDMDRMDKQQDAYYTMVKEDFAKDFVKAVRAGDAEKAAALMEAVQSWNERHPDMPMGFAPALMRRRIAEAGMPLNERTLRTLPRQLRGTSIAIEGMP